MEIESVTIKQIANGFLVSVYKKENRDYHEDEYFCKNTAQVLKLIKEAYPKPVKAE